MINGETNPTPKQTYLFVKKIYSLRWITFLRCKHLLVVWCFVKNPLSCSGWITDGGRIQFNNVPDSDPANNPLTINCPSRLFPARISWHQLIFSLHLVCLEKSVTWFYAPPELTVWIRPPGGLFSQEIRKKTLCEFVERWVMNKFLFLLFLQLWTQSCGNTGGSDAKAPLLIQQADPAIHTWKMSQVSCQKFFI